MSEMTEKLYYKDGYMKEFIANIIECKKENDKYYIVLDETYFFPGGGGQWCDLGFIDGIGVIDVIEEKNKIYHILESEPKNKESIKCSIDWERRFDGMQQHLGQHLLSGCFYTLFNANTCGIHIGDEISTVDIVGTIEEEKIREAEKMANRVICENHKVEFLMTKRREAKKMGLRRDLATKDEEIRIVKIDDIDINACCGIHPSSTLELQLIKIKGVEKHKGNTRITYLTGGRAINDYLHRDSILDSVCLSLSSGTEDVISSLNKLQDNYNSLRGDYSKIRAKLSEYEMKELVSNGEFINNIILVRNIFDNEEMKNLNKLATTICEDENRIVLFGTRDKDKCNLLFACSKNIKGLNMGALLKDSITLVDGKGGGSPLLAQGGGKNVLNLESAVDYAVRRIKMILMI